MPIELILIIAVILLLVVAMALLLVKHLRLSANYQLLQSQVAANEVLHSDLQINMTAMHKAQQSLAEQIDSAETENSQVSKQLEHRIKTLQASLSQLESQFIQLQEQQPQDKFYTRANKLAEKGADVEEIMAECELPRAEVEMLLAIHKRNQP